MSKRSRGQSRQLRPDPAAANIRDPQQQGELEQDFQPEEKIDRDSPEQQIAEHSVKEKRTGKK